MTRLTQRAAGKSSEALTDETFVPFSRGFLKHLSGISFAGVVVYLFLLLKAAYRDDSELGWRKGVCNAPIREIAAGTGASRATVGRALRELEPRYIETVGRSAYRIQKYKTVSDFLASNLGQTNTERNTAKGSNLGQNSDSLLIKEIRRGEQRTASRRRRTRRLPPGSSTESSPGFTCSHGDCLHRPWHCSRYVAELTGRKFRDAVHGLPAKPGRWLSGSKTLALYTDTEIRACVERKLRNPKWRTETLWPQYVAEDISAGGPEVDSGLPPSLTDRYDAQLGASR